MDLLIFRHICYYSADFCLIARVVAASAKVHRERLHLHITLEAPTREEWYPS